MRTAAAGIMGWKLVEKDRPLVGQLATISTLPMHKIHNCDDIGELGEAPGRGFTRIGESKLGYVPWKGKGRPSTCRRDPSFQHQHFQLPHHDESSWIWGAILSSSRTDRWTHWPKHEHAGEENNAAKSTKEIFGTARDAFSFSICDAGRKGWQYWIRILVVSF